MSAGKGWAERFLLNVIWNWIGVAVNLLAGFFLAPYLIRKLGDEQYGIWALAFAFIDYFTLFDFGFKSAAVNLISRFRAQGDTDKINEVFNTSLFYFLGVGGALFLLTLVLAGQLHHFFTIPDRLPVGFFAAGANRRTWVGRGDRLQRHRGRSGSFPTL